MSIYKIFYGFIIKTVKIKYFEIAKNSVIFHENIYIIKTKHGE
jgi:hypothetical protein